MQSQEIKIYTLPTCGFCQQLKEYLTEKKLVYEEIDVLANEEGGKEMVEISGQTSCPVLEYKGQIIIGYQKVILDSLFG